MNMGRPRVYVTIIMSRKDGHRRESVLKKVEETEILGDKVPT